MVETDELYPKLVVFDLDYTIWLMVAAPKTKGPEGSNAMQQRTNEECWCDTHIAPPIKAAPDNKAVIDRYGDKTGLYRDVPSVMLEIHEHHEAEMAAASRTAAPDIATKMMKLIQVREGQSVNDVVRYKVWGTGSKVAHFKELHARTGIAYEDMLFFDDETRNRDVERKLGVMFILVEDGVTRKVYDDALAKWRAAKRSKLNA